MQFVTFFLNNQLYGIDIRIVNNVSPNIEIIPVLLSNRHITGLINIRGQVVLVMDIMVILGQSKTRIKESSHVVILKTTQNLARINNIEKEIDIYIFGDKPIGFLVDMIGDVVSVDRDNIEMPTRDMEKNYAKYLNGIVKLENKLLTVLNPEKMIWFKTESSLKHMKYIL